MPSFYVFQSISSDLLIMERSKRRKDVLGMVVLRCTSFSRLGVNKERERVGLMGCMRK